MKNVLKTIGLLVLYFVLCLAVEFTGFLSPYLWVFFGALASLVAATPVLILGKNWKKPGALCIFSAFWGILMFAMGEYSKVIVPIFLIVMALIAELVRKLVGYEKQQGLRLGYACISAGLAGAILPLFFYKDWYYQGAVEEMGSVAYADTLMKLANVPVLILVIVAGFGFGYLGAIISEKIFKGKVTI